MSRLIPITALALLLVAVAVMVVATLAWPSTEPDDQAMYN